MHQNAISMTEGTKINAHVSIITAIVIIIQADL